MNPHPKSNKSALPTSIVTAETPSLEKDSTLIEATPLASQPIAKGQLSEEVEKHKTPEALGT